MVAAIPKFIASWLFTANRWALCFIALGLLGLFVGTKAEVPKWVARLIIAFGGQSLFKACYSLLQCYSPEQVEKYGG